ncbi:hypothetical protein [Spongiactinospora gelatinilytica]|uniref:hypothetical protein n=1 Tax=Spongiactinospora gelatinilytica TaxID=2666298 RepID=UPI0018F5B93D|nr:hypothetical protein [Spongiactinospora gelatinilytica]
MWAMAGAGGLSIGSLAGGVLTQALAWEAVSYVNVPPAVIGIIAALRLLPADGRAAAGRVDIPGALTGTAGVTLLIYAIAQGSETGWPPTAVAAAVLSPALIAVFLILILLNALGGVLLGLGLTADGSCLTVPAGIVVVGLGMGVTYEGMWIAAATGVPARGPGSPSTPLWASAPGCIDAMVTS